VSSGVLGLGCPAATSDATSPSEPQTPASAQAVPAAQVDAVAPRRAPDLSWDSAVGWEPRFEFPAGVTSRLRRLMLWSADEVARHVLSRCTGLTLEVVDGP
jgi:hypothetical protein